MVRQQKGFDTGEVVDNEDQGAFGDILPVMDSDVDLGEGFHHGNGVGGGKIGVTVHLIAPCAGSPGR